MRFLFAKKDRTLFCLINQYKEAKSIIAIHFVQLRDDANLAVVDLRLIRARIGGLLSRCFIYQAS